MDSREVAEKLFSNKKFELFHLHKLEQVGDKYNWILKQDSPFSKNGFYIYSFKGADTEIDAIEGAVLHVIQTGGMMSITVRKIEVEEPKKKKKEKVKEVVVNEEPPESSL